MTQRYNVDSSRAALDRAAVLLKMSMGGLRIDNLWGTGGGRRPVTQLIKEVQSHPTARPARPQVHRIHTYIGLELMIVEAVVVG